MRLLPLPGVFQPPSDAWLLATYLRRERRAEGASVLDLCTGSGMLAISAALSGAAEATAVDISRRAVAAVRLNAWLNGVWVRALRGDLFEPLHGRRFDVIVSNPPYLPGDISELPRRGLARAWEGGRSGRTFIDRISAQAREHLRPGGALLLVYSTVCGEAQTLEGLRAGGLDPAVAVRRRGPLGPRLAARAEWLRRQGLLLDGGEEEILVVRARAPRPAESASPSRDRRRSTWSRAPSPGRIAPAREAGW
jgi:release factor glutamine methyltransferase